MSDRAEPRRDWDAATYDRISDPQLGWAVEQLERLELHGDEVVLDAGCGSGRVTALLLELLPQGRVYAVDAAPSMVAARARGARPAGHGPCQDLVDLALPEPVDAVFSNATFHWIPDHDLLFSRLHEALKPGDGWSPSAAVWATSTTSARSRRRWPRQAPFAPHFANWAKPWNYAGAPETQARLEQAGFREVECWLEPKRVELWDPRPFVETVCLVRHLDPLPEELRGPFVDAVLETTGVPVTLDYVRLNMTAQR